MPYTNGSAQKLDYHSCISIITSTVGATTQDSPVSWFPDRRRIFRAPNRDRCEGIPPEPAITCKTAVVTLGFTLKCVTLWSRPIYHGSTVVEVRIAEICRCVDQNALGRHRHRKPARTLPSRQLYLFWHSMFSNNAETQVRYALRPIAPVRCHHVLLKI